MTSNTTYSLYVQDTPKNSEMLKYLKLNLKDLNSAGIYVKVIKATDQIVRDLKKAGIKYTPVLFYGKLVIEGIDRIRQFLNSKIIDAKNSLSVQDIQIREPKTPSQVRIDKRPPTCDDYDSYLLNQINEDMKIGPSGQPSFNDEEPRENDFNRDFSNLARQMEEQRASKRPTGKNQKVYGDDASAGGFTQSQNKHLFNNTRQAIEPSNRLDEENAFHNTDASDDQKEDFDFDLEEYQNKSSRMNDNDDFNDE